MADRLNYAVVEEKLSSFAASCDSMHNAIKAMDNLVSENVGVSGGAIYGQLGSKLSQDWDNNCANFLNFRGLFEEWHSAAIDIVAQNADFEQAAVEATADVYKMGGAN